MSKLGTIVCPAANGVVTIGVAAVGPVKTAVLPAVVV
jgi:hypothetical protein